MGMNHLHHSLISVLNFDISLCFTWKIWSLTSVQFSAQGFCFWKKIELHMIWLKMSNGLEILRLRNPFGFYFRFIIYPISRMVDPLSSLKLLKRGEGWKKSRMMRLKKLLLDWLISEFQLNDLQIYILVPNAPNVSYLYMTRDFELDFEMGSTCIPKWTQKIMCTILGSICWNFLFSFSSVIPIYVHFLIGFYGWPEPKWE